MLRVDALLFARLLGSMLVHHQFNQALALLVVASLLLQERLHGSSVQGLNRS